ncbi:MAG TPA: glycosyltransferase family 4 protein [Chitinophagaceae bacterium]
MNQTSNHLVILTPGFPVDEHDSTCLPMQQQLVRHLQQTNSLLHIRVLSLQYPYFKKTYHWHGIPVTSFDGRNKGGVHRLLLRQQVKNKLKEIHSRHRIDALLSFWYGECAWVADRFAQKHGSRHVCWILGQDAKKDNNYPGRLHLKASSLAALSDFIQDEFEKNHQVKPANVIAPGVELMPPDNDNVLPGIDLLATGSLIPLKQFNIFIEVVLALKNENPSLRAVLIGDGPEKARLRQLIQEHGLQETVTLTGELTHADVLKHMQRTKIFIHPSAYEGFGVVCLEALAAGCQVVSFVKPMRKSIQQWSIVRDKKEMIQKTFELLNAANKRQPVVYSKIGDTAESFRKLLGI